MIAMLKLGSCWCFWQHRDKHKTLKTPPKSGMTWSLEKHWMNINKIPLHTILMSHLYTLPNWYVGSLLLIRIIHVSQSLKKYTIWGFPKIVVPQNGWFIIETPIKMDDLGVPLFPETPIYTYLILSLTMEKTKVDVLLSRSLTLWDAQKNTQDDNTNPSYTDIHIRAYAHVSHVVWIG